MKNRNYLIPLVHAESDYLEPLHAGDPIKIDLGCQKIGETSFTITHEIFKNGTIAGKGRTVHVTMDRKSGKKISLPEEIKKLLKNLD